MNDREIRTIEWAMKDAMRTEACKFAEWCAFNMCTAIFKNDLETVNYWVKKYSKDELRYTTATLYELFKKENP